MGPVGGKLTGDPVSGRYHDRGGGREACAGSGAETVHGGPGEPLVAGTELGVGPHDVAAAVRAAVIEHLDIDVSFAKCARCN